MHLPPWPAVGTRRPSADTRSTGSTPRCGCAERSMKDRNKLTARATATSAWLHELTPSARMWTSMFCTEREREGQRRDHAKASSALREARGIHTARTHTLEQVQSSLQHTDVALWSSKGERRNRQPTLLLFGVAFDDELGDAPQYQTARRSSFPIPSSFAPPREGPSRTWSLPKGTSWGVTKGRGRRAPEGQSRRGLKRSIQLLSLQGGVAI